VSTVAGALRRQVWIDQLLFKWVPNFYIIFVGPPGIVTKSTTLSIGYALLSKVPGVHFGPDSVTWHGLGKKFETAFEYKVYKNGGVDMKIPMSPLTCSISELGTFLRPDDKGLVSFLTDIWDGKDRPFSHATKDSGEITIENPWLNVIGATTPTWMANNFPPSLLSEGIGSRVVFVYGDTKRHLTAYPSRSIPVNDYRDQESKLLEDLKQISKLCGEYRLTDEAYQWGETWYAQPRGATSTLASSRYGGYLARKQTHLHKLAMILAASQRDDLLITVPDLIEADQILSTTEISMIRVFENLGVVDEAKYVAELMAFIRAYSAIPPHALYYQNCHSIMSAPVFKAAIHHAMDGGLAGISKGSLTPAPRRTH
jgi:hypothetical protein